MSGPHFLEGIFLALAYLGSLFLISTTTIVVSRICIELCSVLRGSMVAFVRTLRLVTPTVYDCKRQDFLIACSILFYHDTADIFSCRSLGVLTWVGRNLVGWVWDGGEYYIHY